jgi:hypothetical protein
MPTYTHMNIQNDVAVYALSIDRDKNTFLTEANELGGKVIWLHLTDCANTYCSNAVDAFQNIGLDYDGSIPSFSIMDQWGRVTYPQVTVSAIACIVNGQCTANCSGRSCTIYNKG